MGIAQKKYIVLNFAIIMASSLLSGEEQELLYIEPMQSSLSLQFGKDASRHFKCTSRNLSSHQCCMMTDPLIDKCVAGSSLAINCFDLTVTDYIYKDHVNMHVSATELLVRKILTNCI